MRASQAPPPQPLPLPPPPLSLPSPPAAPRRGRHRASTSSSSSSSSVSAASSSSSYSCPSPSPAAASPPRGSAASLVPFSWERHAGVPKMNSFRGGGSPTGGAPLPLPPPLRPAPRRRRRRRANVNVAAASSSGPGTNSGDPFAAAFAECTREDGDDEANVVVPDKLWLARTKPPASSGRAERRWWIAAGVGFLDLYGCKSAMAVADGAFLARRPVVAHGRRDARR